MKTPRSDLRAAAWVAAGALGCALAASCAHDWEALQPASTTAGSSSGGGAAEGGGGATSATSTSPMTSATSTTETSTSTSTSSTGTTSTSATGGSSAQGSGGSGGAPSGSGGAGGTSLCGNGAIDGMEECDDHNTSPGDGCGADCLIECTENGGRKFRGHCYWLLSPATSPTDALCGPQTGANVHLVTFTDAQEISDVASFLGMTDSSGWTGGTFAVPTPQWMDGETWNMVDTTSLTGNPTFDGHCIALTSFNSPQNLKYAFCSSPQVVICEREPLP